MKYQLTEEDRRMAVFMRGVKGEAARMRREAELVLLDKVLREAVMPEKYPHGI